MSAPESPRNEEDLSINSECCDSDLEQPQEGNGEENTWTASGRNEDTLSSNLAGTDWNVEQPQDWNDEETLSSNLEGSDWNVEQPQDWNDEDTLSSNLEGSDWNVEQPQDGNDEDFLMSSNLEGSDWNVEQPEDWNDEDTLTSNLEGTYWNVEQPEDWNDDDTLSSNLEGTYWNVEQPQDGNDEENSCTDDEYFSEHDNSNINDDDNDFDPLFYRPLGLMFFGDLEQAKQAGKKRDKWLLVNVQCKEEFSSNTLNRDTWRDEVIAEIVKANFVFLQVYNHVTLGMKISYFYKIDSFPVILVIHPITGQKMDCWTGMIQPGDLMDKLAKFVDTTPQHDILRIINRRSESQAQEKENLGLESVEEKEEEEEEAEKFGQETHQEVQLEVYPPLPEEPKGDRSLCCRIAIKIPPDGRRIQRNFLLSDPIQLLWSFCFSELDEELKLKPFRLMMQGMAAEGCSSKYLGYDCSLSFEESGLSNTIILVIFE